MSCLFDSISKLLQDDLKDSGLDLRNLVCDYIKNNMDEKIAGETIKNWLKMIGSDEFDIQSKNPEQMANEYIRIIENGAQWGGGPELSILSKVLDLVIRIQHQDEIIATFNCSDNPIFEIVLDWNGSHYEPYDKYNL